MGFLDTIKSLISGEKEIKQIEIPVTPESMRSEHFNKGLLFENTDLKSRIGKLENELATYRERDEDIEEEETVKEDLQEQVREMKEEASPILFSFKKFYYKYFNDPRFRESLAWYSFDRKTRLAGFGDFLVSEDGSWVLTDDKKRVMLSGSELKDLIQSPPSLGVDVSVGRIPLNMKSNGEWIENLMHYEAPEIIRVGSKVKFARARKKPVYDIIGGLNETIGDLQNDLAEAEQINIDLQNENDQLKSQMDLYEKTSETARAELSQTEERIVGIDKVFRGIQKDMLNMQNLNAIKEENLKAVNGEIMEWRAKAEREGTKISDEKAQELYETVRASVIANIPDTVVVNQEVSKEKT